MNTRTALALGLLLLPSLATADPWVDSRPGHGFVDLAYSRNDADQYFTGPGETLGFVTLPQGHRQSITIPITPTGAFFSETFKSHATDQSMRLSGQVSLGRGFGFVLAMPLVRSVSDSVQLTPSTSAAYTGAGDLVLGIKYQLPLPHRVRGFALSPQIYVTAPTGNASASDALKASSTYAATTIPLPTGNGTVDLEMRVSAGYRFDPIPIFVSADVGYHHHLNESRCHHEGETTSVSYSDDLPYAVHLGGVWEPKRRGLYRTILSLDFDGTHSFENGDVPDRDGAPFVGPRYGQVCGQNNNQSAFSMGATLAWFPIRWAGLQYSISHVLTGVNVGYSLVNTIGIVTAF